MKPPEPSEDVHVTSIRMVGVRLFQPHCSCDWAGLLYPTTYVAGLVAAEHENGWNDNPGAEEESA